MREVSENCQGRRVVRHKICAIVAGFRMRDPRGNKFRPAPPLAGVGYDRARPTKSEMSDETDRVGALNPSPFMEWRVAMKGIDLRRASTFSPVNGRTFLVATVEPMPAAPRGETQGQLVQPVASEADCPLDVISPLARRRSVVTPRLQRP